MRLESFVLHINISQVPKQCLTHDSCAITFFEIANPGRIPDMGMKIVYLVPDLLSLSYFYNLQWGDVKWSVAYNGLEIRGKIYGCYLKMWVTYGGLLIEVKCVGDIAWGASECENWAYRKRRNDQRGRRKRSQRKKVLQEGGTGSLKFWPLKWYQDSIHLWYNGTLCQCTLYKTIWQFLK